MHASGLGFGDGRIAVILSALIVVLVAYLAVSCRDVQVTEATPEPDLAGAEI